MKGGPQLTQPTSCLPGISVPFPGWQIKLKKKKPNSPAINLVIQDNQGIKFISIDLIPALEMAGQWPCTKKAKDLLEENEQLQLMRVFYFVAEQSPGRQNKGNLLFILNIY